MPEKAGVLARRHWIPPAALIFAQLAHGFSWLLILLAAWSGNFDNVLYAFAWIHSVALGWITMAALAILIFAIPQFTDVVWRGETIARWSLAVYAAGVAALIWAFLRDAPWIAIAAAVVLAALLVYLTTAFVSLAAAFAYDATRRVERAVARAFAGTFLFLLATALLGFGLAWMLGGGEISGAIVPSPPSHAALGTLGWLSLLIFGVSMRTLRPITGVGTRFRMLHVAVGSLALIGVPILAAGLGLNSAIPARIGAAFFAVAAIAYCFDVLDILRRATVRHRAPQAFVAAAIGWFLTALVLGAGTLFGEPWQGAYIFVLLAGWTGQMVNAHLHHIGVRLLATVYRGEGDETPPQDLLEPRLSWYAFAAIQIGVALVVAALLRGDAALAARGAVFGLGGWIAMIANLFTARARARVITVIKLR